MLFVFGCSFADHCDWMFVDCQHGRCSSVLTEGSLKINRSCYYSSKVNVGIDIRRWRSFSQAFDDEHNYYFYRCTRQLCNDSMTENSVQMVIHSYAAILDISRPSKPMIMPITDAIIWFFHFFHSNYLFLKKLVKIYTDELHKKWFFPP